MGLDSLDTVSVGLLDLVVVGMVLRLGHSAVSMCCGGERVEGLT